MKRLLLLTAVMMVAQSAFGQGEVTRVGTTAANFLRMEVGTKAVALGGAFTALADDATATFWNPAGLVMTDRLVTHYENIEMYAGMNHQYAAAVIPVGNTNVIGLSVNYFSSGDIEITTVEEPDGTGQNYDASSYSLAGSYSRRLTDRVSFGASAKYIRERIWRENADGFAFDVGTIYRTVGDQLTIGMTILNLGPSISMDDGPDLTFTTDNDLYPGMPDRDVKYLTERYDLPVSFNLGFTLTLMGAQSPFIVTETSKLIAVTDVSDGFDGELRNNWGIEYTWQDFISLRGGYRVNYDVATWSAGAGIILPVSTGEFVLDYALSSWGELGDISLWSLELKF